MSIRGIWILNETGQLVLARRFPTVEKKQQLITSSMGTMCNISAMSDSVFVKAYMSCLEKVISDQLSNECFLMFALRLNQKGVKMRGNNNIDTSSLSEIVTSYNNGAVGDDSDTYSTMSDDLHTYDSDQEDMMEEFLIWPFVAIVVGGISIIALPFMDAEACRNFIQFYKSQMTELQKRDSLIFNLTNSFKHKCTVTTNRLPFSSHQNNNESIRAFDLIDLPSITGALCLLQDLSSAYFMAKSQPKLQTQQFQHLDPAAVYLHMFLSQCMPFGRPIETSPNNIHLLLSKPLPEKMDVFDRKKPAWRSHEHNVPQDKQRISIIIRENIESVQYDKPKVPDKWSCYGSIICSADVFGSPDINVQLSNLTNINHFAAHRCCSQYPQTLHPSNAFTLTFIPPPGAFVLCKYTVCDELVYSRNDDQSSIYLPLRGFYQMRQYTENDREVIEILVQLKLHKNASNNFEYCNVYIPFPNREIITDFKLTKNTLGQVTKSNSNRALIWKLGNKFKSKDLEATLNANIFFRKPNDQPDTTVERKKDPFLVGSNAYVKLSYKMLDYSISGIEIDSKSVSISPNSHLSQVLIRHETISNNCMIWNSNAQDVRYVVN